MKYSLKNTAKWIFGFVVALMIVAISAEVLAAPNERKNRDYPGGADEEDLKVQTELPAPPVKVDRKSIEQKALQGFLKKGDTAPAANTKSEEQN